MGNHVQLFFPKSKDDFHLPLFIQRRRRRRR